MNGKIPRWLFPFQLFAALALLVSSCSGAPGVTLLPSSAIPIPATTVTPSAFPCTVFHTSVTPAAALGAEFEGHGHVSGPANAPVTLIAFSDYQCTQCAILAASLQKVRLIHSSDVRLIYLHAPQATNDKDALAIQAVEAADLQGKFWEMHDLIFAKQAEWYSLAPADFEGWAESQASSLGMDPVRFRSDYSGAVVAGRLKQAVQFATSVQSFTPPLLFVNDTTPYTGLADFASLDTVIRLDALTARQYSSCPTRSVNPLKQYTASLHTTNGDVELQLYPDKSPLAVSNFIFLTRSGWYNNIPFYRVIPGSMAMTGDPSGTGYGNPGYLFATEIPAGLSFDQPGMVAMDNNGPDSNGSRFFITLAPETQMDGQYTIIGKVLSGLDILSKLTARNPQPGVYLPAGDELLGITIEER